MIKAEIVADSLSPQGDRLISVLATFPRIILSEINTHRMLSKNTSSSRAIPFKKMVETVQENPFIPIAWQFDHKGMQGTEYITEESDFGGISARNESWLSARDYAIQQAEDLNSMDTTKQLCNRLLEPFMWTTELVSGTEWNNFFELRCPSYLYDYEDEPIYFKSKKDWVKYYNESQGYKENDSNFTKVENLTDLEWLQINKSQAEIHIQALAESMWDAMNESTPKKLRAGDWHIPFGDKINDKHFTTFKSNLWKNKQAPTNGHYNLIIKIATARAARLSYMTFDGEIDYEKDIKLHDKLLADGHMSPFEHCARAMSDEEYNSFLKTNGKVIDITVSGENIYSERSYGWCRNFKGFKQYRYLIEEKEL